MAAWPQPAVRAVGDCSVGGFLGVAGGFTPHGRRRFCEPPPAVSPRPASSRRFPLPAAAGSASHDLPPVVSQLRVAPREPPAASQPRASPGRRDPDPEFSAVHPVRFFLHPTIEAVPIGRKFQMVVVIIKVKIVVELNRRRRGRPGLLSGLAAAFSPAGIRTFGRRGCGGLDCWGLLLLDNWSFVIYFNLFQKTEPAPPLRSIAAGHRFGALVLDSFALLLFDGDGRLAAATGRQHLPQQRGEILVGTIGGRTIAILINRLLDLPRQREQGGRHRADTRRRSTPRPAGPRYPACGKSPAGHGQEGHGRVQGVQRQHAADKLVPLVVHVVEVAGTQRVQARFQLDDLDAMPAIDHGGELAVGTEVIRAGVTARRQLLRANSAASRAVRTSSRSRQSNPRDRGSNGARVGPDWSP